jgi:Pectate lyase superfamily protein
MRRILTALLAAGLPLLAHAQLPQAAGLRSNYATHQIDTTQGAVVGFPLNVMLWGAKGDGVTDDSAAIQAAITAAGNPGTVGGVVYFPPGHTYIAGGLVIQGSGNATQGQNGVMLSGYGATIKGRPSDTTIISTPFSATVFANGLRFEGFTLDSSAMANSSSVSAIAINSSYNSSISDVHILDFGNQNGLLLGKFVFTYDIHNLACHFLNLLSTGPDLSSTCTFTNCEVGQISVIEFFNVNFIGGAVQNSTDGIILNACFSVTFHGVDIEISAGNSVDIVNAAQVNFLGCNFSGSPTAIYAFTGTNSGVVSTNNNYSLNGSPVYLSGTAPKWSSMTDRIVSNAAVNALVSPNGSVSVSVTTTAATTVYTNIDGPVPYGLMMIFGDNGTNGFQDLVMVANGGNPVVLTAASGTWYGSPPTRTYTLVGGAVKVALSSVSGGAYSVRTMALNYTGL